MKQNESQISCVVGVRKPLNVTSHDVVNCCRNIFGTRRCGHAGTLDPAATGVLPICVGCATRLSAYLSGSDKCYRATIGFGISTDTDDAQGRPLQIAPVPNRLFDRQFAQTFVEGLPGVHKQVPPLYSAVKVNGKKSYEAARVGQSIALPSRDIEIYEARLLSVCEGSDSLPCLWHVMFRVSKGTYIRALARDMGRALGCPAHVVALERVGVGNLLLDECVSLEELKQLKDGAALDPVALLGCRFICVEGDDEKKVNNGAELTSAPLELFGPIAAGLSAYNDDACGLGASSTCGVGQTFSTLHSGVFRSMSVPYNGELVAVLSHNKLAALYSFDEARAVYHARCVFQTGVSRGRNI